MLDLVCVNRLIWSVPKLVERIGKLVWMKVMLTIWIADGGHDGVVIASEEAFHKTLAQASIRTADQDYC